MFEDLLQRLGLTDRNAGACGTSWIHAPGDDWLVAVNPATAEPLGQVAATPADAYERVIEDAQAAFLAWRNVPAPRRGEVIRRLGQALRECKRDLGLLVTLETGKIRAEGEGEVQEMIDMCDFAVGLSRQLYGLTIASERPEHRMMEQWHPLGPVGIITAFNFPVAVWSWNAALAAVCGDTMVWKPSPITPLTAVAVQHIANRVAAECDCPGVFNLCVGGTDPGERMIHDRRLPLISATGSCRLGTRVGEVVGRRLGRSLLELGGNNAIIVTPSANLDLALRATLFAAVGTAGQRCTSVRRLIVHESVAGELVDRLVAAYRTLPIGNPWEDGVLVGPLIHENAVVTMMRAIERAKEQGGDLIQGGKRLDRPGFFVEPALVRARPDMPVVGEETFAPILYVLTYRTLDEALALHNAVEQGLTSAIFTESLREAERFLSAEGSDCGIANVNIGTSGAEIGGAFGGEKASGGGREAGSDAWKAYMRRQTCTINRSDSLPLAQGIRFDATAP
ncbi:MAG: aldehyde dehydrogenase family protein [Isosphaeraceae bacterium]|nr:aldehyde dehydrogenase family protein [Isosphaeraceae bacterium]